MVKGSQQDGKRVINKMVKGLPHLVKSFPTMNTIGRQKVDNV